MEENFSELLEKSLSGFKYREGQIIKGTVLSVTNDTVVVDVGLKSEGRIPLKNSIHPEKNMESKLVKNMMFISKNLKIKKVRLF